MGHYAEKFLNQQYLIITGVLLVIFAFAAVCQASGLRVHHNLQVELFPAAGKLIGIDNITIKSAAARVLEFHIAERVSKLKVAVNQHPQNFNFENGRIRLTLEPQEQSPDLLVTISYAAIFDDPVPVRPVNPIIPVMG